MYLDEKGYCNIDDIFVIICSLDNDIVMETRVLVLGYVDVLL